MDIIKRLQEHWNYAAKFFDEDRFIGIFLYGSQNYGMATEDSDVDSKLIILPSLSDLALKSGFQSSLLIMENQEHIEVKDIRAMRQMFLKQNINFIETLYTDYYILNPKYEPLYRAYFINNREAISHYNCGSTLRSVAGQAIHTIAQNPYDNKKLANAWRLYYFLKNYVAGKLYKECLQAPEIVKTMKNNNTAETVKQLLYELVNEYNNIQSPLHIQNIAQAVLDEGTVELLKAVPFGISNNTISKKEFFKNLTDTEIRAYYYLIEQTGVEGTVNIPQLVTMNNIAHPIYYSVLKKLKKYNFAEITKNHIKITQPELRAEILSSFPFYLKK